MKQVALAIFVLFSLLSSLTAQPADVLKVNFGTSSIETDPAKGQTALEAQVLTALYEGLVTYDPLSLRAQPGAAQTWAFSDDRLTLTFTLRKGLVFEDGTPLTAEVFRDSWIRLLHPRTQAPFASLLDPVVGAQAFREGKATRTADIGISAPDATTLILRLVEPAPHLVAVLCHYAFVPVHPGWLKAPTPSAPRPMVRTACSRPTETTGSWRKTPGTGMPPTWPSRPWTSGSMTMLRR